MQSLETLTERDFDSVWEIMEESFPRDERRSREAQRKILDVSWYHLYGYRAHGELMAFLAVWEFDTFLFVEHFAVRKSCRNGGLGAVLLTQLTAQCEDRSYWRWNCRPVNWKPDGLHFMRETDS